MGVDMTVDDKEAISQTMQMETYAAAIADAKTPTDAFKAAETASQSLIGHALFTLMIFDAERMEVERCYSSDPTNYPAGGRKKKRDTEWGQHVLMDGKPYIGSSADDIRASFNDHEVILKLGLISVLNVPIQRHGSTIGTMNMLDKTAHYSENDAQTGALITSKLIGFLTASA